MQAVDIFCECELRFLIASNGNATPLAARRLVELALPSVMNSSSMSLATGPAFTMESWAPITAF
jgi:hypothetical protein